MSLRVWLPLNGDLHNQGLSNVTATNHGATVSTSGKIGSCYIFDGIDDYLSLNNLNLGNKESFSICFWVYAGSNGLTNLIQIKSDSVVAFQIYEDGKFSFRDSKHGSLTDITFEGIVENIWTNYSIIYDNGDWRIYKNGIICKNFEASQLATFYPGASTFYIGARKITAGNYYFTGKLNDFRIYDHALSELEVKEIARGLILHYPLNNNGMGNKNLLTNDWNLMAWGKESGISVSWDDTVGMYKILDSSHTSSRWGIYQNITLTANTTYTFSVDGMKKYQNVNFGFAEGTSWPANAGSFTTTVSRLSKTITVGSADANCRIYLNINPVSNGSNYGYFRAPKLEIGSVATPWGSHTDNTIEYDISGYCNNGTKIGTFTYSTDTPKYRVSTYINNGANDYITTSATIGNPADAITMNIWFKSSCTTPGSNYHEIFNHATSVQYFEFAIYKTGYFRQGITINGTRYVINGGSGLLDGNWHMLTATYDGIAIKRYIDGEIITNMTQSVTGTLNGANAKFLIGHYGSNTSYYAKEAYLSDARIYATALSAQDILSLYHNSALVDEQGIIHGAIH